MYRFGKMILCGVAGFAMAIPALAQLPQNIAQPHDFRSFRASSTDPQGHNHDYRSLDPGKTLTLADIHGHGQITHMWFTIASPDPDHLRQLVLRIRWDDSARAAVETPLGIFFVQPPLHYVEFSSSAVSVGGRMALNCYWPMPFHRHAVITITNEGSKRVDAVYYNIDYRLDNKDQKSTLYFHTQYRTDFPATSGKPVTICDAKGSGQYVGTVVSLLANSDGWWGEGNDIWYIDDAKKPTIEGTGTEDYFCGAWDFGHAFETPYFGVTYYDDSQFGGEKRGITNVVYRWHIMDPVAFQKSLRFDLEQGSQGGNETRVPFTNNYTTLAFYYSNVANGEGPALPPYPLRVPELAK